MDRRVDLGPGEDKYRDVERALRKLPAADWLLEYVGPEALTIREFAGDFYSLRPVNRRMRGINDPQDWCNEYACIRRDTSARRRTFGEPVFLVDAEELRLYLADVLAEMGD